MALIPASLTGYSCVVLEDGAEVRVGAMVSEVKPITTKSGKRMAIVTLEDMGGRIECTVFPDTFETTQSRLLPDTAVVATGRVELREDRAARLLLQEVRSLEEAGEAYRRHLHIEVHAEQLSEEWMAGVDEILSAYPGGSEVYLHIVGPDHVRRALRSRRFRVAEDDAVIARLKERHPQLRARWGKAAP